MKQYYLHYIVLYNFTYITLGYIMHYIKLYFKKLLYINLPYTKLNKTYKTGSCLTINALAA